MKKTGDNPVNYKKVIEDFNNGKIDPEKYQVIMADDGGYWFCTDENIPSDNKRYDLAKIMTDKYGDPDGYHDIVDVLIAAGVNCAWC